MAEDDQIRPPVEAALTALQALRHHKADDYEQKLIYQAVEQIAWLAPKVRYAINEEIDASTEDVVIELTTPHSAPQIIGRRRHTTRAKNEEESQLRAMRLFWDIEYRKALIRAKGNRPRGGIHDAVYQEVADKSEMTVDALKQLIKVHGPPRGDRREFHRRSARAAALRKLRGG